MKTQLIKLQEKFILVSDEIAGYTYNKPTWNSDNRIGLPENNQSRKIIAGIPPLPSVDLSLLKEKDCKRIGWVDVEKLAETYNETLEHRLTYDTKEGNFLIGKLQGWINGFKTFKSLNDKMFSLEQIEWAFLRGALINQRSHNGETLSFWAETDKDIQSLQQTSWDVEVNELNQITRIL